MEYGAEIATFCIAVVVGVWVLFAKMSNGSNVEKEIEKTKINIKRGRLS